MSEDFEAMNILDLKSIIKYLIGSVKALKIEWYDVVTYFQHHVTNEIAESINFKIHHSTDLSMIHQFQELYAFYSRPHKRILFRSTR